MLDMDGYEAAKQILPEVMLNTLAKFFIYNSTQD